MLLADDDVAGRPAFVVAATPDLFGGPHLLPKGMVALAAPDAAGPPTVVAVTDHEADVAVGPHPLQERHRGSFGRSLQNEIHIIVFKNSYAML